MSKKEKTPYQERMTGFLIACGAYSVFSLFAVPSDSISVKSYIFWSVFFLAICMAKGFDAVYDSLNEKIGKK